MVGHPESLVVLGPVGERWEEIVRLVEGESGRNHVVCKKVSSSGIVRPGPSGTVYVGKGERTEDEGYLENPLTRGVFIHPRHPLVQFLKMEENRVPQSFTLRSLSS